MFIVQTPPAENHLGAVVSTRGGGAAPSRQNMNKNKHVSPMLMRTHGHVLFHHCRSCCRWNENAHLMQGEGTVVFSSLVQIITLSMCQCAADGKRLGELMCVVSLCGRSEFEACAAAAAPDYVRIQAGYCK